MRDFSIELISAQQELISLVACLDAAPVLALDIETVNWWDREAERVALVQLAFRADEQIRVVVIDALAGLDLEDLRPPLEASGVIKVMHNAAYDAVRLARHFRIHTAPIHDTMLAARRAGENRCSLQAQAHARLGIQLDKSEQRGDWARRPINQEQLRYAALDAVCTLLLYEDQRRRGLAGSYHLRAATRLQQTALPLVDTAQDAPDRARVPADTRAEADAAAGGLRAPALALLGVITELTGLYSPDRLAASAGGERVGLAGWIIDQTLGPETDIDENTAKLELADLCIRGLVNLNTARRLEATDAGAALWRRLKLA